MKAKITLIIALAFSLCITAQDQVFTHTATVANTSGHITYIDHPDLNGNSSANMFFTHNLQVGGTQYNNKVDGSWYDGAQWSIFNEDITPIIEDASYNVYVIDGAEVRQVTVLGGSYTTEIDDALINADPNAVLVFTKYWNPNGVYNTQNYGFWYDDGNQRWNIYAEDLAAAPTDAVFKVLIGTGTGGATSFSHQNTPANTTSNYTMIDHPSLNGNPDAFPIVSHNWGTTGDTSNVVLDVPIGVWYDGSNWTIYTEDTSPMSSDAKFNVYVAEEILSVENNTQLEISAVPNPVNDKLTITALEEIKEIVLFNVLGQEVLRVNGNGQSITLDISNQVAGVYLAAVETENGSDSIKILKN